MFVHCGLLLMFLSCVRTTRYINDYGMENSVAEMRQRYSLWPTMHLGLLTKREVQNQPGMSEGEAHADVAAAVSLKPTVVAEITQNEAQNNEKQKPDTTTPPPTINSTSSAAPSNGTAAGKQLDLQDPAVLMRGIIVFGGFLLLAIAYYIFYRKKGNKTDTGNTHSLGDNNQFRYGVLHSEDKRDNMELSRIPLTMESDDDDDEDLEIFDLEQRKKSLSYVNLQTNDEELVFPKTSDDRDDRSNLLLDIEDASADPFINWSSNGNKSIL